MDGWLTNVYDYCYVTALPIILLLLKESTLQLQQDLHCQLLQLVQHMPLQQQINSQVNVNVCTPVGIYYEIQPEPSGNPSGSALGLRLYFTVYLSSCHNTDTVCQAISLYLKQPILQPAGPHGDFWFWTIRTLELTKVVCL